MESFNYEFWFVDPDLLIIGDQTPNNNAPRQLPTPLALNTIGISRHHMAITLTETAAERVKRFLDSDGGEGLRVGVRRTGCSGWAYQVQLAETISDEDIVFEDHGVRVVVAPESLSFVDGSEIDFVTTGLNRVFQFKNPNVTDECGCGESFTIE